MKNQPNQKHQTKNRNIPKLIAAMSLALILLLALLVRLWRFDTPLADFHSWRQADTVAVARNMQRSGINMLEPRYDDLSNIQSGQENPQGYRMVEFPLYNVAIALLDSALPIPIEQTARLISILSSLVVIAVLFDLARREYDIPTAIIAALIYAIFPFFVFFSRVALPETPALACVMLSIYCLYRYCHSKSRLSEAMLLLISAACFAAALLIKPTAIFYAITLGFLFIRKYTWDVAKKIQPYLYFIVSFAPLLWWRNYILIHPEGIPASEWLITGINTGSGLQPIFFRPAFFRWIFFERINNIILGAFMFPFFVLGIIKKHVTYLGPAMMLSAMAYVFTFQGGNVQHEYYQVLILPPLALFCAMGITALFSTLKQAISPVIATFAVVGSMAFALLISLQHVKAYYDYPDSLVQIAKIIGTFTQPSDKIVTDTLGDTTLLFLSDRRGAPAVFDDLVKLKEKGYSYFMTQKPEVIEQIKQESTFEVVFESDKFALFRL